MKTEHEFRNSDNKLIRLTYSGDTLITEFFFSQTGEKPISVLRTRGKESNEVIQWLRQREEADRARS